MSITLLSQTRDFGSNRMRTITIATDTNRKIVSPSNSARRGGLIVNSSSFDLLVWFGANISPAANDWIVIPPNCNCDIPVFFVGEINAFWRGSDNKTAKIFEFYGD